MSPQIKLAVAAALAAAAGAANATDIQFFNPATAVVVDVGGSTAIDNTFVNASLLDASAGMCNTTGVPAATGNTVASNTVDLYTINTGNLATGAITNRLLFCNASGHAGVAAGTPLVLVKESNGGSGNGFHPVAQGTTLAFLDPALLKAAEGVNDGTCTNAVQPAPSAHVSTYTSHVNCGNGLTVNNVPTGGVADVEGNLLAPAATAAELAAVNAKPGLAVVWGLSVTKSLYYALQHGEGLDVAAAPCNVPNNDNPLCAPTLTKAQAAGVFGGTITDWSQLKLASGAQLSVPGNQAAYVCRRDNGSGTEASFEYYYLNARCSTSDETMVTETGANVGFVFTNTSTGNVRNCLEAANWGSAAFPYTSNGPGGGVAGTASAFPAGSWAIGVISTEVLSTDLAPSTKAGSTANPALDDFFRFVKIDNALPTLENVVNGRWDHFSEDVFYTNKVVAAAAGAPVTAFNALQGDVAQPLLISDADSTYDNRPWGDGGDLVPATNPFAVAPAIPATQATILANPTNALSKALSTSGQPNNCDIPQPDPNFFTLTSAQ